VLAAAILLLLLDATVTAYLLRLRRRRRRLRARRLRDRESAWVVAARQANDDLARRQALLHAQRVLHPTVGMPAADTAPRAPVAGATSAEHELRRDAALLAAMGDLVYDPAVWER